MKKLLSILLVCAISLSLFVACGEKDEIKEEHNILTQEEPQDVPEADNEEVESPKTEEPKKEEKTEKPQKSEKPLKTSENKEVATTETAPEVFIIEDGGDNNARICYHLENCKTLQGTKHQKVTWEFIEMLQFRQCPECNPPRYAGYVE